MSVRGWASAQGFEYQFLDDALFSNLPNKLREKFGAQPVVLSDLARLRLLQAACADGYERAVWLDTDMLVFDPNRLQLPDTQHAVGREVWVQVNEGKLRAYRKVHNAFMMFAASDSFLPFYADTAESFLQRTKAPVVPQFIGPKLLTAQHNLTALTVCEEAGMLSPLCLQDVINGGGAALDRMKKGHGSSLAAVNLSASYEGRASDGVLNDEAAYQKAVDLLLERGAL